MDVPGGQEVGYAIRFEDAKWSELLQLVVKLLAYVGISSQLFHAKFFRFLKLQCLEPQDQTGPDTLIKYMTDGMLLREILSDDQAPKIESWLLPP